MTTGSETFLFHKLTKDQSFLGQRSEGIDELNESVNGTYEGRRELHTEMFSMITTSEKVRIIERFVTSISLPTDANSKKTSALFV